MNDRYVGGAPQFDDHWGDKKRITNAGAQVNHRRGRAGKRLDVSRLSLLSSWACTWSSV